MHISSILYLLAHGSLVIASPAPQCAGTDACVSLLKGPLKAIATSFCLAYLGGDKTVTSTSIATATGPTRTTTVTQPDSTVTSTVQTTITNTITSTETDTNPPPTTTTTYTDPNASPQTTIYQKRDVPLSARNALPPKLSSFAASRISSACSCIVTPATHTSVATQTTSVPGPLVTATEAGKTVMATITNTNQVTQTQKTTTTVDATTTVTYTQTVGPIVYAPKICNARGLPGPNAYNYDANFNSNQADCIASCKTDNRCYSTGFYIVTDPGTGSQTGTCRKYDKSVTASADLGPGYYNFNDKAC